jgi:hypothetical protein
MGIVQRLATRLGSAHRPALVGRIAMGFCQVGWVVRNGANPLKGVQRLGFTLWPKPHHPRTPVNLRLPALQPQLTQPQIGSLYPLKRPPAIRSRKPSPDNLVFGFQPKPHHPRALVNPHLPAPQPQLTQPQIGLLYPLKRPPVTGSRKPSPGGSVFTFWPKSPHPHTSVNLRLPALQPQLTPHQIGLLYQSMTPPMLNS